MARWISEEELEGRMDCFGEFDVTDEICLKHCGINLSCANRYGEEQEFDWMEAEGLGLPDIDLD